MVIIDRRENPKDKSLGNTQRFLMRAKSQIKNAVDNMARSGNIEDLAGGNNAKIEIKITDVISEPSFSYERDSGDREFILPGNKDTNISAYIPGDKIDKPEKNGGKGSSGAPDGNGEDDFQFILDPDEFKAIFFEDLELPNQKETAKSVVETMAWNKSGFKTNGSPANISLKRTMQLSLGRRFALKRPNLSTIKEMEEELASGNVNNITLEDIEEMKRKTNRIPYIDPIDVRYHNLVQQPRPIFNAVMFCLMDVSGSMDEDKKDLAKRFYVLLYTFLKIKYTKVDVVFIRHTSDAKIVTEDDFFNSTETGGTVVSPGINLISSTIRDKYPTKDWNIYVAQASDGDNYPSDNSLVDAAIRNDILSKISYYFYIETKSEYDYNRSSDLWAMYDAIASENPNKFAMNKVKDRSNIYPVFRKFMSKGKS